MEDAPNIAVPNKETKQLAQAIYKAKDLYLSPSDSMKAAQAALHAVFLLSADQQYRLAFLIADNIGYDLKSRDPLAELSVVPHQPI